MGTKEVAIGGPLLKGSKLIIGPLSATWNGAPIIGQLGGSFSQPGLLTVNYDTNGELIDTTGGVDATKKKIVHVKISVGTQGVPPGELVFASKTPVTVANRPDVNNCPPATMTAAKADCAAKYGAVKMSCLTDYCFAGKEVALAQ